MLIPPQGFLDHQTTNNTRRLTHAHYARQTTGVEEPAPLALFSHDTSRRQTPIIQFPP